MFICFEDIIGKITLLGGYQLDDIFVVDCLWGDIFGGSETGPLCDASSSLAIH